MPGNDIFISYCREERPVARQFAESFAREGFTVWWDAVLRSGQTFDEVIERELRAAKAVVVLWSPRSVRSRWVRAEATLADRGNKLFPIIIEPCELPIIFELTHTPELVEWSGDTSDPRWQTLIGDLRRMVGGGEEAIFQPPAAEPPAPQPTTVAPPPPEAAAPELEAAAPAPEPEPEPQPEVEPQMAKPARRNSSEAIMAALERLGKRQESGLSQQTPDEEARAEFYQQSDEYRMLEGDEIHCLLRLDGEQPETRFVVTPVGLKIGRAAPADIIVSGQGVSRSHCLVEYAAGRLRVTDLNSTNGTFVDNKRVIGSEILGVGSLLRVGNVSFEHVIRSRDDLDPRFDPASFSEESDLRSAARH